MKYDDPLFGSPSDRPRDMLETFSEEVIISYGMCVWRLQEMCGLTYKEARAHMAYPRETRGELAETFGITPAAVRNLQNRAAMKIRNSGYNPDEVYGKYLAVHDIITGPREFFIEGDLVSDNGKRKRR